MQGSKTMRMVAALGLLVGTTVAAQAQPPVRGDSVRQDARQERRETKRQGSRPEMRQGRGGMGGALFRGITLTSEQRAQVEAVQARFAEQRKSDAPRGGAEARRTRPDSATRARLRAEREQQFSALAAELRTILTAEQRPTFDRNLAAMRERAAQRPDGRPDARRGR